MFTNLVSSSPFLKQKIKIQNFPMFFFVFVFCFCWKVGMETQVTHPLQTDQQNLDDSKGQLKWKQENWKLTILRRKVKIMTVNVLLDPVHSTHHSFIELTGYWRLMEKYKHTWNSIRYWNVKYMLILFTPI